MSKANIIREHIQKVTAERDYWKREAIKNAAELGEVKIKQTPIEVPEFTSKCPVCGNQLDIDPEDSYCSQCGQAVYWD